MAEQVDRRPEFFPSHVRWWCDACGRHHAAPFVGDVLTWQQPVCSGQNVPIFESNADQFHGEIVAFHEDLSDTTQGILMRGAALDVSRGDGDDG